MIVDEAESVASTDGIVRLDGGDGERGGVLHPIGPVEVVLHLLRVGAAENEDLLDAHGFEPRERVVDHRSIHKREKHLQHGDGEVETLEGGLEG